MTGTGSSWSLSVQRREAADRQREVSEAAVYHTVVSGETLWGIARAWGMTLGELLVLNPQIKNPNVIQPGQRLRVRG